MSGLLLLPLFGVWVLVVWLITGLLAWIGLRTPRRRVITLTLGFFLYGGWFGWTFLELGGRNIYYDGWVDEQCEKDGGETVYETVVLPSDQFSKYGGLKAYDPRKKEGMLGPDYQVIERIDYFNPENPRVSIYYYKIMRRSDGKVLGEGRLYGRGGGVFFGLWSPVSYRCPRVGGITVLMNKVFKKSTEDRK